METVEETREELLQRLAEYRGFLTVSCQAFDAGQHAEAKRLAASLRVLLQHPRGGRALLVQLETRDQIGWLDTAGSMLPVVAGAQTPLVYLSVDERLHQTRSSWLPTLDAWDRRLRERPKLPPEVEEMLARMRLDGSLRSRGSWMPFDAWWTAEVLRDSGGRSISRGLLVNALASTDREPHADPELDALCRRLSRPESFGWATKLDNGPSLPLLTPALASVRQIAFEVEASLHRGAPTA